MKADLSKFTGSQIRLPLLSDGNHGVKEQLSAYDMPCYQAADTRIGCNCTESNKNKIPFAFLTSKAQELASLLRKCLVQDVAWLSVVHILAFVSEPSSSELVCLYFIINLSFNGAGFASHVVLCA